MTEKDSIKDLEFQAANTKRLVDRINLAMYGMTWEEHTRLMAGKNEKGSDSNET